MPKDDIEADFPALIGKAYDVSDEDFNYNCLAYALGDYHNWWEPPRGEGRYWPPGFSEDVTVGTVEAIIRLHGFTEILGENIMPDTDSIAIYATRSNGFKRGSLVQHVKHGLIYVGGCLKDRISLHSLSDGKRLTQTAKIEDCLFLAYNSWRTRLLPQLKLGVSGAGVSL